VLCDEAGGWQDQIAASFGGFNRINFSRDGSYDVLPVIISPDRKRLLDDHLMMFFTGFTHFSSEIQRENEKYEDKIEEKLKMLSLVDEAEDILTNNDKNLDDFGLLLDETWKLKRQTGHVITTEEIDEFYERGKKAGALGGKLLGAGGGGFLIFYVPLEKQEEVRDALKELLYVPFHFENEGTRVLYYAPEEYMLPD
jgi:D-glycero-alpha-D-manno-heptose-7-phosphate kinase